MDRVCEVHLAHVKEELLIAAKNPPPRPMGTRRTGGGGRKPTVVIIGGGVAGGVTARWFDKWHSDTVDLVLVDPKSYHEFTPHINRARVSTGEVQKRIRPPHTDYVVNGQVVVERCTQICADHIKVGSVGVIPFDYCVRASTTPKGVAALPSPACPRQPT